MIFYSDQITADIIDNNDLDVIADKVDGFKDDINMLFTYFTYSRDLRKTALAALLSPSHTSYCRRRHALLEQFCVSPR